MGALHTLVVYGASPGADASLHEAAREARRQGGRLSVVALAGQEPERRLCCDIRSVYWNRLQRELAESDLARARLVVEDADDVALDILRFGVPHLAAAIARRAASVGAGRILLADRRQSGLGRWAVRRLRRRSPVPVIEGYGP
jgi:hypothetical protein